MQAKPERLLQNDVLGCILSLRACLLNMGRPLSLTPAPVSSNGVGRLCVSEPPCQGRNACLQKERRTMAELKTKPTQASVDGFLASLSEDKRRGDCEALRDLMEKLTGQKAVMWGEKVVGFGLRRYEYPTGRTGEWYLVGFSPRKTDLTLYFPVSFEGLEEPLSRLGKCKTGKACLYIKTLEGIDLSVLEEMLTTALQTIPPNLAK